MKVVGEKNKHKHSFKMFLTNFKINFQADGLRNQFKLVNSPCKNEIITKKKRGKLKNLERYVQKAFSRQQEELQAYNGIRRAFHWGKCSLKSTKRYN